MSLRNRLICGGVAVALGCLSAFSTIKYLDGRHAYQLSGGPQIAKATAALNDSLTSFGLAYPQLVGPGLENPYVDISNASANIKTASSSLETAVKEAEEGITVRASNGFDNSIVKQGFSNILSSRETVNSILASLPSGTIYHGGKEQSLLVEANKAANEALQMLEKIPLSSNYKAFGAGSGVGGAASLAMLLLGVVFYNTTAEWFREEPKKKV